MNSYLTLKGYRNPLRMEVVRQVIPLLGAAVFVGVMLGYAWRMAQG